VAILKDKTISGFFWSLLQNVGSRGVTFVVMIVLARLLTPEIFGLIGMLMIFIQLSQILVQAGFNQALIQKKEIDEEDYSSVFWINLGVSLLIYGILFAGAPWISIFYEQPVLTKLTRVLSLVFIINAFSYVQEARLTREMRFKTLTIIHIPSTVIGGALSVTMALMDYGVWSLIALQITTRLAYTIQIWFYAKWKPLLSFNTAKAKTLFSFGGKLMLNGIINTVFQNSYLVVIGKFFPVSAVGYYQYAQKLVKVPSSTISGALYRVAFPAFSSIQDDNRRLRENFKKLIQQVTFWLCPTFVLAGVLAEPLFSFVLGKQWLPAVPYFQWLCAMGIFIPLNQFNPTMIKSKGHAGLLVKMEILKKTIMALGIIIAIPFGVMALIISQVTTFVMAYIINGYFTGKVIGYTLKRQVKDLIVIFLLAITAGLFVYFLDQSLLDLANIFRLVLGGTMGGAFYILIARILKLNPCLEFVKIIKNKRNFFKI